MHPLTRRLVRKGKLAYLWVTRILLAPNRFGVGVFTRIRFAVLGGFAADQIALYDLKRTPRNRRLYLSEFDWYRSRWINEPFDPMLNNKVVCAEILQHHVSVPRIVFLKNKGRLVAFPDRSSAASVAEVIPLIREVGSLFLKPIAAGRGVGVFRLDADEDGFRIDGGPASESDVVGLLTREDGWFLSETVAQHPDLGAIYPHTSNTVRVLTMRDAEGDLRISFAVLRIGTAATIPVDNGSRGGLIAHVDLETGRLSEARTLWSHAVFAVHPDSGAPIRDTFVPDWNDVLHTVRVAADALAYVPFVAWDVLVTEHGPCIIEANTSTGPNIIQLWGPQRRGDLGHFYRKHGVIR